MIPLSDIVIKQLYVCVCVHVWDVSPDLLCLLLKFFLNVNVCLLTDGIIEKQSHLC